ncbi:MAG: hypothetical protein HOV80_35205 [Polyangiaceae bacterium]|nr:hypothetical protein [Polyangiaceae bacterium]
MLFIVFVFLVGSVFGSLAAAVRARDAARAKLERLRRDAVLRAMGKLEGSEARGLNPRAEVGAHGGLPVATVNIVPPLDLGLAMRSQLDADLEAIALGVPGLEDHVLGDEKLDAAFLIGADEPRRVDKLLGPVARQLLLDASKRATVVVTDQWVRLAQASQRDSDFLQWATSACAELTRAILDGRDRVPSAQELRVHSRGYRSIATKLDLTFQRTPLGLRGDIGRFPVFAGARRIGRRTYEGMVVASFPSPLGLGLMVRGATQLPFSRGYDGVDFLVGNEAFDDLFLVKGDDPYQVLEKITPAVQSHLMSLAEAGAVELTDEYVMCRLPGVPPPERIGELLERVVKVAEVAASHLAPAKDAKIGPYR